MSGADLYAADLHSANLYAANLSGADLSAANLPTRSTVRDLGETPSGPAFIFPTPDGWRISAGCWLGERDELRKLIAQDEGWPDARDDQVAERGPSLESVLQLADWHVGQHPGYIARLHTKWSAA
ncbi:MAG: pentapeptide repeat-containing protein [Paracoccus sp. (in: a-proteobacteria)]